MIPVHHPDDATLASYAAGSTERNFSLVLDLHVRNCDDCQHRIAVAEWIGGALLQETAMVSPTTKLKEHIFQNLEATEKFCDSALTHEEADLPDFLRDWRATDADSLPWKQVAPGIRQIRLPTIKGQLSLLRISPGTCIPAHGHQGNELTLVLSGSYSDEIGRFTPGCIADLDERVDHQPIADRDQDCICLTATDAPLRFHGWVPRLLQAIFRL